MPAKSKIFESKPRFKGLPLVCLATNLAGFDDEKSIRQFIDKNSPHASIERIFICEVCKKWHFTGGVKKKK